MKNCFFILCCLLAVGCQSYEKRVYDVTLKNDSTGPVTVWLTKDGPPYEPGWLAPEDLAIESPKGPTHVISGLVVASGKTAFTGPRKGQFEPQTRAVLRVYAGQLKFEEMLATSEDDKRRIDLRLHPGVSDLVVTGTTNAVQVKESDAAP